MTFLITAPYKYSYLLTSLLVYNNLKILKFTRVITLQLIRHFSSDWSCHTGED